MWWHENISHKTVQIHFYKKMLQIVRIIMSISFLAIAQQSYCQVVSEAEAVNLALANYPSLKIAELRIAGQRSLQKTAFNPSQPSIVFESPTDVGLGYEVEQEFDFPTVYTTRSKWLKGKTRVAEEEAGISQNDLIRDVRLAYLNAQLAKEEAWYYHLQDSIWKEISKTSNQLYEGGELNKAELLFAQRQAAVMSFQALNASLTQANMLKLIESYTGTIDIEVEPVAVLPVNNEAQQGFYFTNYLNEQINVAEREMEVRKSERLPGIILGYMRNSEFETNYRYRFKGGITVPIWQSQYSGEIQALQSEIEQIRAENELMVRESSVQRELLSSQIEQTSETLAAYRQNILPQTNELLTTYMRLYEGGQADYTQTMKYIVDASDTFLTYIEMLRKHNEAVIELDYLNGGQRR